MKNTIKILAFSIPFFCCSLLSSAYEYEKAVHANLWNSSANTAGIRMDSISVSTARLFGKYDSGSFRDTYMAESSWSAGAEAKTITHLDRFSMNGSFSFENFSGKGMTGSMSSRPGYYPIDMLEFTPGDKTMQTYRISGGISIDLNETFLLGAGLDYNARNYTKRKDLRHTTWLMDMTANIGLIARIGNGMSLGLSYFYNKSSEKIKAEELGISSSSYYAFHDKGMMFGTYDIWTGGGTLLKEGGIDGFPTKEHKHGAGLQLSGKGLFAELKYTFGTGDSGEKDIRWYRFPSHQAELYAGYKFRKGLTEHFMHLDASYKTLTNRENVIVKETEGGVTNNVTYGSNLIFAQKTISGKLSYEAISDRWAAWANVGVENTGRMSSLIYPYLYTDMVFVGKARAGAMVSLWKFDLAADFVYSGGKSGMKSGNVKEDLETDKKPHQYEEWYNWTIDYMTVPQLHSTLALRFNFLKGLYIKAEGKLTKAFKPEFIGGCERFSGILSLGYTF